MLVFSPAVISHVTYAKKHGGKSGGGGTVGGNSNPSSENSQPTTSGSDTGQQQQLTCPDGSEADANGNCIPETQSPSDPCVQVPISPECNLSPPPDNNPPAKTPDRTSSPDQQQQCPIGENFDNEQNTCVKDTPVNTTGTTEGNITINGKETLINSGTTGTTPPDKSGILEKQGRNLSDILCAKGTHYDKQSAKCVKDTPPITTGPAYDIIG